MSIYFRDSLVNIKKSITSILDQTYKNHKLYIIIDGHVNEYVNTYLDTIEDERIFLFKRKVNKGLAYSLNELLKIILLKDDCKYIARMDADDISLSNRIEKQILFMNENTDVDCLGTWAIEIDNNDKEYFKKQMPTTHDGCLNLFRKRDCLIHPTVLFRRSYFNKAGLYPEYTYFGEDTIMWAQGFKNGCRFANLPEYLLKFRLDSNFFERRSGWKHAKSIFILRRQVNKLLSFGIAEDIYALLYGITRLMPKSILNLLYRIAR